jgi:hypothetical protein
MLFDYNGKETRREFITKDKKAQELLGRSLLEYGIPLEYVSGDGEQTFDFYSEDSKGNYKSLIVSLMDMKVSNPPVNTETKFPIVAVPEEVIWFIK